MSKLMIGTVGSPEMLAGAIPQRQALLRRASQAGIDHIFIADHISFHTGMGMDGLINAATLTALAPDLSVLIGVYLLALRHPVPVARQLSSLSLSAPGRIVLGVGVGGEDRHEMEICGVDPARRGVHTTHALRALKGLMQGEPYSYRCDFFEFEEALIKPAPQPAIPILIGGRADAALRRAALHGDGWLGIWSTQERFAKVLAQIDETAAAHDRSVSEWQHGLQLWVGTGRNKAEARQHVAAGMEEFYQVPFEKFERYSPYGSALEIAEYLSPYVELGARTLNIAPRGPSEELCIDTVAEVSALLKKEFPQLC